MFSIIDYLAIGICKNKTSSLFTKGEHIKTCLDHPPHHLLSLLLLVTSCHSGERGGVRGERRLGVGLRGVNSRLLAAPLASSWPMLSPGTDL